MITVHLIPNAHLDPIWLWPWQAGLDAALATCRSACDLLDRHRDLTFARGEAWVYDQIERVDPELFQRIARHIAGGQWEIVNGWWIQPDCNQPSGFAMQKQIELGKRYFQARFGRFPRVAYNVDSFGHAATLPAILRAAGQDRYVMMRPQEHEMRLPARLFRWRGYAGGPEVVAFRIAGSYNTTHGPSVEHVRASLSELPAGVKHTMCFIGVGDHGGGPSEELIQWCRDNERAIDGCRLVFSTPARFFDAIDEEQLAATLPLVTGELQHHAIGCYSVYRPIKTALRRAEQAMAQAEVARRSDPHPSADIEPRLEQAWRHVCFNHFHDTLGGTCIPSAYPQAEAQLGSALASADEIVHHSFRRQMRSLPDDPMQRIAMFNASDEAFDGYAVFEPWLEWKKWQPGWRLLDESGAVVPHQVLESEALAHANIPALLFRARVSPSQMRTLRIDRAREPSAAVESRVRASAQSLHAPDAEVQLAAWPVLRLVRDVTVSPRLDLIEDTTDTWSHGIDRYGEESIATATWEPAVIVDQGPIMASAICAGRIGDSGLWAEFRVYHDEPFVEMNLRVRWVEQRKVLKLTIPTTPAAAVENRARIDGILGGHLERDPDGKERPLRDWTMMNLSNGNRLGIVAPDVFALDATSARIRLTLLRSCWMAFHEPYEGPGPRGIFSDQGVHHFRFRFFAGGIDPQQMDRQAKMLQRPLIFADLTRGMKPAT